MDIVVCIIRALQIHKITGASVSFGKVILSATFNILFQSIVTSVFRPTEERDDSEHLVQAPTYKEPTINIYPPIQSELQLDKRGKITLAMMISQPLQCN